MAVPKTHYAGLVPHTHYAGLMYHGTAPAFSLGIALAILVLVTAAALGLRRVHG